MPTEKSTPPEDLFRYVRESDERMICEYTSTERTLRREGVFGFFLPALGGGLFLVFFGIAAPALFSGSERFARPLAFLGLVLCAAGSLFYALFLRRARMAAATALYITDRRVVYITGGSYAVFELCEITGAYTERARRMSRVPFDMASLEGEYLVLCVGGSETRLPFIERAEDAAAKILSLVG